MQHDLIFTYRMLICPSAEISTNAEHSGNALNLECFGTHGCEKKFSLLSKKKKCRLIFVWHGFA